MVSLSFRCILKVERSKGKNQGQRHENCENAKIAFFALTTLQIRHLLQDRRRPSGIDSSAVIGQIQNFKNSPKISKSKFRKSVLFFSVFSHRTCVPTFVRIRQTLNCRMSSDLKKVWQHSDIWRDISHPYYKLRWSGDKKSKMFLVGPIIAP